MGVQKTTKRLSKQKLWSDENFQDISESMVLLAQNAARRILQALSPTAITNNSGGSTAGPVSLIPTGPRFIYGGGANYAPRAGFNTAIATVDNAIATLATYLNSNVFTPLAAPDSLTLNSTGTVTANTVAAITQTLTGTDGAADPATGTWSDTAGQPVNGDTVTVGGKTYTFQSALTNADGNVAIGANTTVTAANLVAAVTLGAGSGTAYAAAMTLNANVTAVVDGTTATQVDFSAKVGGPSGNSIALSKTGTGGGAVSGATLTGGIQDTAMLRSEMNAAISAARNNFATLLKAYNTSASFVNAPSILDASGGTADQITASGSDTSGLVLVAQPTATTTVTSATVAATDAAALTDANNALSALAADISYIAAQIGSSLLSNGVLTNKQSVLIYP